MLPSPETHYSPNVWLLVLLQWLFLLSINFFSFCLDLSHALSTSRRERGNVSQHILSARSPFHLPPVYLCRSKQVFLLPRTLLNSNVHYWHNRQETCVAEPKYISYRPIFSYISLHFPSSLNISLSHSLVLPQFPLHISLLLLSLCQLWELIQPSHLGEPLLFFLCPQHTTLSSFVLHFKHLAKTLSRERLRLFFLLSFAPTLRLLSPICLWIFSPAP